MNVMEIVLLIVGIIIFLISFLFVDGKKEILPENKEAAKEEIKSLVSKEMDNVREHVDDVVEEAVGYAVEKTERSLERLTNEKIMAVNEYSDTVLQEIHKNHEEVMFLYDMLNDKHTNLKNTVTEVHKTVKEVEATTKEAEAVVNTFQKLTPTSKVEEIVEENILGEVTVVTKQDSSDATEQKINNTEIKFGTEPENVGLNRNEQILELFREGKSNVAIAKKLGLGVGEVKLVIDLYKNM